MRSNLPEYIQPQFTVAYAQWNKEAVRGDDYTFHAPNASSIIKKEECIKKVFNNKQYVDYLFMSRAKAAVDKYYALLNAGNILPIYDDSDLFWYVISTACADTQYHKKYIGSINYRTLTEWQIIIVECIKSISTICDISPSMLWVFVSLVCLDKDADKISQAFDIDLKRGRNRCLEIIKKEFT